MTYSLDFSIVSTKPVDERVPGTWQAYYSAIEHLWDSVSANQSHEALHRQAKIAEGQAHIQELVDSADKQTAKQFLHRVSNMLNEQLETLNYLQEVFPAGKICELVRRFMGELCSTHNIQVWEQRRLAIAVLR